MSKKDAPAVLDRLWLVYGVKSDNELSDSLNRKRSTLGSWRARNSVPYEYCVTAAEEKGVSLDWLLTGEGPVYRGDRSSDAGDALSARERAILDLFRELEEADQREICGAAAEKKRLKDMEQRIEELAAALEDLKRSA